MVKNQGPAHTVVRMRNNDFASQRARALPELFARLFWKLLIPSVRAGRSKEAVLLVAAATNGEPIERAFFFSPQES